MEKGGSSGKESSINASTTASGSGEDKSDSSQPDDDVSPGFGKDVTTSFDNLVSSGNKPSSLYSSLSSELDRIKPLLMDTDLLQILKISDRRAQQLSFLPSKSKKTGFVYDEIMLKHKCLWDNNYPEKPARLECILDKLKELGILERCHKLNARSATKEEITRVHTDDHYKFMSTLAGETDEQVLEDKSSRYDAVYFHPLTFEAALFAAGSVIELVDAMINDEIRNGFALVRPPGHHALADEPCGYCFFNNVAIAAAHAIKVHKLERILIVDWDVHHGQATQFSFEEDEKVLYFSIHKFLDGKYWPQLPESNFTSIGKGPGKGFNVNIPLNAENLTDYDYLAIFHNILLPIAHEFNPQLILVSAGFDAAIGCPEGNMRLSPPVYAHLTHYLMGFANGKLALVLEGGYFLPSLAESAAQCFRSLLGDPCPLLPYPANGIHNELVSTILDVIWSLKPYWYSLRMQKDYNPIKSPSKKVHIPDIKSVPEKSSQVPDKYPTRDDYPVHSEEVYDKFEKEVIKISQMSKMAIPEKRTCIIYHHSMNEHVNMKADGTIIEHPERPLRTISIFKELNEQNLVQECTLFEDIRLATNEELGLAHSPEHIARMALIETLSQKELDVVATCFSSIYFSKGSNKAAKLAVGGLLQVTDAVCGGKVRNGFALVRPPGHHASEKAPAGFCIYNNVVIAARYAIQKYNLKRILIVDWDVHHGDGTQSLVENDDEITFISLHRYENALFYPSSDEAGHRTSSERIINIPWNGGAMSDADYILAFCNLILPIIYEIDPQIIMISSGFDAAIEDPLGGYELSPEVYGHFTHLLSTFANGKLILTLEGGYDVTSISQAAANCVSVLLGNPPKPLVNLCLNEKSPKVIRSVYRHHAPKRKHLQFGVRLPRNPLQ